MSWFTNRQSTRKEEKKTLRHQVDLNLFMFYGDTINDHLASFLF